MNRIITAVFCSAISLLLVSCNKEKEIAVTSVSISRSELEMFIGETVQLVASVSPSDATNRDVIWSSENESVAMVSSSGLVAGVGVGVTFIIATAGGKSAHCLVGVGEPVIDVASVTLNITSLNLNKGQTETLIAEVAPSDATDKMVYWSTSNSSVAQVNQEGMVTAVGGGEATITAKAGEKTANCVVTVTVPVSSISLNKGSTTLEVDSYETLVVTIEPEDATERTITWSCSDNSVASVDNSGKVVALREGDAVVTAKVGELSASCSVHVTPKTIPVSYVQFEIAVLYLEKNKVYTLTATVKPDNATDKTVSWSSSDSSIATVSNGEVKGIKVGTAIITASAGGKSTTCKVHVRPIIPEGAVDLGLSVFWGTNNIGASSPEQSGEKYAWAETEVGYDGNWDIYSFYNVYRGTIVKYNTKGIYGDIDNKTVLEPEDDVAHVKLGGKWRMPTKEEFEELSMTCSWKWTTKNGVNGHMVTSLVTGESIFLPVTRKNDSGEEQGRYWSSSLVVDYPTCAYYFRFSSKDTYKREIGDTDRYWGYAVRPVYSIEE